MSRRLSILYYSNEDAQNDISTSLKRVIRCRHYLFALFIGFQEGYLFGSIIKVIKENFLIKILIFYSYLFFSLMSHVNLVYDIQLK
jgi:hypothetical protein